MQGELFVNLKALPNSCDELSNVNRELKAIQEQLEAIRKDINVSDAGARELKQCIKAIEFEIKEERTLGEILREILQKIIKWYIKKELDIINLPVVKGVELGVIGKRVQEIFQEIAQNMEEQKKEEENFYLRVKDRRTTRYIPEPYLEELLKLYNSVPEQFSDTKSVFDKHVENLRVFTYSMDGGKSHFSDGLIYLNSWQDRTGERKKGTTFYHEYGHFVAYEEQWDRDGVTSELFKEFDEAVKEDVSNYISEIEEKHRIKGKERGYKGFMLPIYVRNQTLAEMEMDICENKPEQGYIYDGISDIIDGVSNGKYEINYGHEEDYWEKNKMSVAHEAFANMFAAEMTGDVVEIEKMKEIMPNAYECYRKLIESAN